MSHQQLRYATAGKSLWHLLQVYRAGQELHRGCLQCVTASQWPHSAAGVCRQAASHDCAHGRFQVGPHALMLDSSSTARLAAAQPCLALLRAGVPCPALQVCVPCPALPCMPVCPALPCLALLHASVSCPALCSVLPCTAQPCSANFRQSNRFCRSAWKSLHSCLNYKFLHGVVACLQEVLFSHLREVHCDCNSGSHLRSRQLP